MCEVLSTSRALIAGPGCVPNRNTACMKFALVSPMSIFATLNVPEDIYHVTSQQGKPINFYSFSRSFHFLFSVVFLFITGLSCEARTLTKLKKKMNLHDEQED